MFIISHTGAVCRAKLQTASKTDVSLAEKYVSNLEFLPLTGKRNAAEAPFGVSAADMGVWVMNFFTSYNFSHFQFAVFLGELLFQLIHRFIEVIDAALGDVALRLVNHGVDFLNTIRLQGVILIFDLLLLGLGGVHTDIVYELRGQLQHLIVFHVLHRQRVVHHSGCGRGVVGLCSLGLVDDPPIAFIIDTDQGFGFSVG